jgi:hypothetical protein
VSTCTLSVPSVSPGDGTRQTSDVHGAGGGATGAGATGGRAGRENRGGGAVTPGGGAGGAGIGTAGGEAVVIVMVMVGGAGCAGGVIAAGRGTAPGRTGAAAGVGGAGGVAIVHSQPSRRRRCAISIRSERAGWTHGLVGAVRSSLAID